MPAKRILPYVILGIIEEHGQLSGKDITKEFTTDIGEFWKSSHSQIYP
ncbi:PadR family transcriptional regulator, partial [Limosilactobacillus fermentum]